MGYGTHEAEAPRVARRATGRPACSRSRRGTRRRRSAHSRGEHVDGGPELVLAVARAGRSASSPRRSRRCALARPAVEHPALGAEGAERRLDAALHALGAHRVEHGAQGDGRLACAGRCGRRRTRRRRGARDRGCRPGRTGAYAGRSAPVGERLTRARRSSPSTNATRVSAAARKERKRPPGSDHGAGVLGDGVGRPEGGGAGAGAGAERARRARTRRAGAAAAAAAAAGAAAGRGDGDGGRRPGDPSAMAAATASDRDRAPGGSPHAHHSNWYRAGSLPRTCTSIRRSASAAPPRATPPAARARRRPGSRSGSGRSRTGSRAMTSRWFQCRWPLNTARTRPLCSNIAPQLGALLDQGQVRAARPPARVLDVLLAGRVVHQHHRRAARRRRDPPRSHSSCVSGTRISTSCFSMVCSTDEVPAALVERVVERPGALPERGTGPRGSCG